MTRERYSPLPAEVFPFSHDVRRPSTSGGTRCSPDQAACSCKTSPSWLRAHTCCPLLFYSIEHTTILNQQDRRPREDEHDQS